MSTIPNRFFKIQYSSFLTILDTIYIPQMYEASSIPPWKAAMESEIRTLKENDTWNCLE